MAKRRFPLALALILLLSLLGSTTSTPATATPGVVEWSRVSIPAEGKPGNWVLAAGSDVQHLTMAIDGTLYLYVAGAGYNNLYKSTDEGRTWAVTGYATDFPGAGVVDIAGSGEDADTLYVADAANVYKSEDAGDSWGEVAAASMVTDVVATFVGAEAITSIAVGYANDVPYVYIGSADPGAYNGDVYFIADTPFGGGWTPLEVDDGNGNATLDVFSVAVSPFFDDDNEIDVLVTDAIPYTAVLRNIGGSVGAWTEVAELQLDDVTPFESNRASDIVYPADFDNEYEMFVGVTEVTTGSLGDVFRVDDTIAFDLGVNDDIRSLDLVGDYGATSMMAGAVAVAGPSQVYSSTDDGDTWTDADKEPAGTGATSNYVVIADDFADNGKAYVATSGGNSAFSYTTDGGVTWNQVGLIDTGISDIVDLAVSPNYSMDNTLFMLTWGSAHSLWRSLNGGTRWERVYSSALANVDSIDRVELSPQYDDGNEVVFIAGESNGNPAIWKSTDNGQSFSSPRFTRDPSSGASFNIDTWAVVNDKTLFIGSYDGSSGLVYRTTKSGLSYSTVAVAGSQSLNYIVLSPDYDRDETILVGNTNGWVYWSDDDGSSFEPLPSDATSAPLTGSLTVAFDPEYSKNNTVYAASDTADGGIYRFIIGTSTSWERIDSNLPEGGMIGQLIVSADGTLYATNFKADGGMERSLNPTYSLGPTFETVTRGLDDGATMSGLWLHHNQLWAIDTTNTRVITYTDSLTLPVILTSPQDKAPGIGTIINHTISNVRLDWEAAEGATSYQWQLDYETDFSSVPAGFEDSTKASSARLPALEPATTYYWRVRVTKPVLSPWSAKWSFTTSLGGEIVAPELESPQAGASGVPLKPVFQWSAVAGADSYEMVVSADVHLGNPAILKVDEYALPGNAWQSEVSLNYDTTYYWKVRARSADSRSAWSAVGAFTTESPPPPPELAQPLPPSSPPPPAPPPPAQPATPDWVFYMLGFLGFIIISLLATILVLALRRH